MTTEQQQIVMWRPMSEAPVSGDCEWVLLKFKDGKFSVGYWDLYYAEGGRGYEGGLAWIEPCSGERLDLHYDAPIGWARLDI